MPAMPQRSTPDMTPVTTPPRPSRRPRGVAMLALAALLVPMLLIPGTGSADIAPLEEDLTEDATDGVLDDAPEDGSSEDALDGPTDDATGADDEDRPEDGDEEERSGTELATSRLALDEGVMGTAAATFFLDSNGVTVRCPDANVGDTGTVNGKLYTKRARADITASNAGDSCTSDITDMHLMFGSGTGGLPNVNPDVAHWDTSSVTDMSEMFRNAYDFNQPIGAWDTSNVTTMRQMFNNAISFDRPIGTWDTSNVTTMALMFQYSAPTGVGPMQFNQPIGTWDTSNVTNMSSMFWGNAAFNQPIGTWDTSNVTNMSSMFRSSAFNQPIGTWDTSNVTNMSGMFLLNSAFDQPIGTWNTANVTSMGQMFFGNPRFNQPIGTWNTANVTSMFNMFRNNTAFNQPIGRWDVRGIEVPFGFFGTFVDATAFNQDLTTWDVERQPTEPESLGTKFSDGATAWDNALKPLWGGAPRPSPRSDADVTIVAGAGTDATVNGVKQWEVVDGELLVYVSPISIGASALQTARGSSDLLVAARTFTVASGVDLAIPSGRTLILDVQQASVVSGVITGDGNLVKNGTGTLTLAADNTYAGTTRVNDGTLKVGAGGTTGTLGGGAVTTFATLAFDRSDALVVDRTIGGSGGIVQQGSGSLTLGGQSTFGGGVRVTDGTLIAGRDSTITGSTLTNGPFGTGRVTVEDGATLELDGPRTLGNLLTVAGSGGDGGGAIRDRGDGAIRLLGAITVTADTRIVSGGPLELVGVAGAEHQVILDGPGSTDPTSRLELVGDGSITAGELLVRGHRDVELPSVTVGTLAATDVTTFVLTSTGALTLGTVAGVDGIDADEFVDIATLTGDLLLTRPVSSRGSADPALRLTAVLDAQVGTAAGGVIVSGSGALSAPDGVARVYSGAHATSGGLTALVGGIDSTRSLVDRSTDEFDPALTSPGIYALYRAPGPATQLVLVTAPEGATSGGELATQPVLELRDRAGNLVSADSTTEVTVTLAAGEGGTLGGTITVTAVDGVVTFTDLTLAGIVGVEHELAFDADGLPTLRSDGVEVTHGPAAQLGMDTQPVGGRNRSPLSTQPVVEVQDAQGNRVLDDDVTEVEVTLVTSGALEPDERFDGTLGDVTTAVSVEGLVRFEGVTVTGALAVDYELRFEVVTPEGEDPALAGVTSDTFRLAWPPSPVGGEEPEVLPTGPAPSRRPIGPTAPPLPPLPRAEPFPQVGPTFGTDGGARGLLDGVEVPIEFRPFGPFGRGFGIGDATFGLTPQSPSGRLLGGEGGTGLVLNGERSLRLEGSGLQPDSTVQVWLTGVPGTGPAMNGADGARELARLRVGPDGSIAGLLSLATSRAQDVLPVGQHVIQITGSDASGRQVVVDMTLTVDQDAPRPELDRTTGSLPSLQAGGHLAMSAGRPTDVRLEVEPERGRLGLSGDGWDVRLRVAESDGRIERQGDGVLLTVLLGGTLGVAGEGFLAGTRVEVWLFSEPALVGEATVTAWGTFDLDVTLEERVAPVGLHTLQVHGVAMDGFVRAVNLGVQVEDAALLPAREDRSGPGPSVWIVAAVLVAAAIIIVPLARRRRRDDELS
jgi:autotransporter-associated beta strand protein/surface protein